MNKLDHQMRLLILRALTEGNSIRGTARLAGCSINTVVKLSMEAGETAARMQHHMVRNLNTKRVQADEIWSFIQKKQKRASTFQRRTGQGDAWTWFAIDADSRLIISYHVGGRDTDSALDLLCDCRERIATDRVQITTDQFHIYLNPVRAAFLGKADYAQLQKIYGSEVTPGPTGRYSPAQYMGQRRKVIMGNPEQKHISTSYCERLNLTLRMSNRRFTRLTNAHSKKLHNHRLSVSLYVWNYNFCRVQQGLRVTPAMEAGCADRVWELADLIARMEADAASAKPEDSSK